MAKVRGSLAKLRWHLVSSVENWEKALIVLGGGTHASIFAGPYTKGEMRYYTDGIGPIGTGKASLPFRNTTWQLGGRCNYQCKKWYLRYKNGKKQHYVA